ncbi:hypothetical protein FC50_GL002218 [Lacticaseibacillus pantheris DSM 15945 = JCM 12539 = NBRC 106106]|uniref:Holin n=2 Tax=Lacticaseibacillus pantheris TaxID=171523 RepID=A0A0R1TZN5_9LACO|nr:hypothetical protein [Lacticaseibacillus pantheris]KRL84371.1 hypothetical protein FC50_GL002218 [Lacticaseibacillus pantheris DSM 15945 = JCM 12539 = NBRC 106106]
MDIANASEIAIIAAIVAAATQFVKSQTSIKSAYLPYLAVGIGIVAGLASVAITHDTNYLAGAVQGAVTAMGTSWAVDAVKPAAKSVATKVTDAKQAKADAAQAQFDAAVAKAVEAKLAATPASDAAPTPAPADGGDSSAAQV